MIVGLGQVDIYSPTAEEVKADVAQWVGNIDPTAILLIGAGIFVLYHLFSTGKRTSVGRRMLPGETPKVRKSRTVKRYRKVHRGKRAGEFVEV